MFLYPILYRAGVSIYHPDAMGIFAGSTIHEVAHVVGAGNAMGAAVSNSAIIVKMIRVMMFGTSVIGYSFLCCKECCRTRGRGQRW